MKTPICDFVRRYCEEENIRLHMPGHKGVDKLGVERYDITEIEGADVLYHAEGIIKSSEENAANLFGTARTVYSAEGSSLSIRAMVCMIEMYATAKGERPKILAGRNAHKAFVMATALSDVSVTWLYGEEGGGLVLCKISPKHLEKALSEMAEKPTAVYITSPDYLGNIADIAGISAVCKKYDTLLFVDNAHGAYLKFLQNSLHPIDLGADVCCDSAHKTLPVITGGGYLHISNSAPSFFAENADKAMSLFASTSPSYLILQSLDFANAYIADSYHTRLFEFCQKTKALKDSLRAQGFVLYGCEPLKITISTKSSGYKGTELSEILIQHKIFSEFADPDYIVFMLTPETAPESLLTLERVLISLPKKEPITEAPPEIPKLDRAMNARKAMFSRSERVALKDCVGRILATPSVSCPPAVPVAVCGERISEAAVEVMRYYGAEFAEVVRQGEIGGG